jgi:polynucleotide 5'-hydroxyl-kinase GRC3/NOL9
LQDEAANELRGEGMHRTIEKGKTLLVGGPASIVVLAGKISALGATLTKNNPLLVRRGRAIPFFAEENTLINLTLGEGATAEEIDGDTVPEDWKVSVEKIIHHLKKPYLVMVIGAVDCGKTTFCTFLSNHCQKHGLKVAVIDADIGQSDIGPPTTISLGVLSTPLTDIFMLRAESIIFVGLTSPSGIVDRIISGLATLKSKALNMGIDLVIVNTDGWVQGEGAVEYKLSIAKCLEPNLIVGIQQENELEPILTELEKSRFTITRIKSSPNIKRRDREERKKLREQAYHKYLKGATLRLLPLNWVKTEYAYLGSGRPLTLDETKEMEKTLEHAIAYAEETPSINLIVLKKRGPSVENKLVGLSKRLGKQVHVVVEGEEQGLLVGLLDSNRKFVGLGVITGIDYERRTLKVLTPAKSQIAFVQFSQVKLDKYGREVEIIKPYLI